MPPSSRDEIQRHLSEAIGAADRSASHLHECFLAFKQSSGWLGQGYEAEKAGLSKAATYLAYAIEEIQKVQGM